METRSIKTLSMQLLQGNRQGNTRETLSFRAGNFEETGRLFRGAVEIVTPEGERLWIATEPAAVKLIPPGAVYFLGDEIMQLQKAGNEAARAALMVKQVFGSPARVEMINPINHDKPVEGGKPR